MVVVQTPHPTGAAGTSAPTGIPNTGSGVTGSNAAVALSPQWEMLIAVLMVVLGFGLLRRQRF